MGCLRLLLLLRGGLLLLLRALLGPRVGPIGLPLLLLLLLLHGGSSACVCKRASGSRPRLLINCKALGSGLISGTTPTGVFVNVQLRPSACIPNQNFTAFLNFELSSCSGVQPRNARGRPHSTPAWLLGPR